MHLGSAIGIMNAHAVLALIYSQTANILAMNIQATTQKDRPIAKIVGAFATDPYHLPRYYLTSLLLMSALDSLLWFYAGQHDGSLASYHVLFVIAGLYCGGWSATALHNASHRSFKPRWLNRIAGELAGIHQLYGHRGFHTAHKLHHVYPDDDDFDPNKPCQHHFIYYALDMVPQLNRMLSKVFFLLWDNTPKHRWIWRLNSVIALASISANLLFWYLLLGPLGFILFFIPSWIYSQIIFAQLNYYTHRPSTEHPGHYDILNLNHSRYYQLSNTLFSGFFYHKNHHQYPFLANPAHTHQLNQQGRHG